MSHLWWCWWRAKQFEVKADTLSFTPARENAQLATWTLPKVGSLNRKKKKLEKRREMLPPTFFFFFFCKVERNSIECILFSNRPELGRPSVVFHLFVMWLQSPCWEQESDFWQTSVELWPLVLISLIEENRAQRKINSLPPFAGRGHLAGRCLKAKQEYIFCVVQTQYILTECCRWYGCWGWKTKYWKLLPFNECLFSAWLLGWR